MARLKRESHVNVCQKRQEQAHWRREKKRVLPDSGRRSSRPQKTIEVLESPTWRSRLPLGH